MAFGREDTDTLYDQVVSPVLRDLGITVRRVDRIEHNDDVDDRIMRELDASDFIIADLTYARPSVYFEAGYGEASKEVIYLARSDHFKARDSDPEGNLRVHFDLQMKNIVSWTTNGQVAARKRLRSRVRHVTKPLLARLEEEARARESEDNEKARIEQFASQPFQVRDRLIEEAIVDEVESIGYREYEPPLMDANLFGAVPTFLRSTGTKLDVVRVVPSSTMTKGDLAHVRNLAAWVQYDIGGGVEGGYLSQVCDVVLALSLRKTVPPSRSAEIFQEHFHKGSLRHEYTRSAELIVPRGKPFGDRIVRQSRTSRGNVTFTVTDPDDPINWEDFKVDTRGDRIRDRNGHAVGRVKRIQRLLTVRILDQLVLPEKAKEAARETLRSCK